MHNQITKKLAFIALFVVLTGITYALIKGHMAKGEAKVMKRVGSLIKVKPEYEERYIILHRNTFPGVLASIKKSNIRNYSIFLLDGMLFSYYEYIGRDFEADMKAIGDPITKDWWKLTDPMQEPLPTRKQGEWWAEMDEFLCMDNMRDKSHKIDRMGLVAEVAEGKDGELKQFLGSVPHELEKTVYSHGFQNSNFFYKDGRLYFYYEHAGKDLKKSLSELNQDNGFTGFMNGLNKFLVQKDGGYWMTMKEVFHTN